jgi:EAL domain-containing protein (putative c-di-GMP-specific phosphodiesterase class I)/PAS domain-containing protein
MICLLITVGNLPTDLLERVLTQTGIPVEFIVANNREALIKALAQAPQLVFYAADRNKSRGRLLANSLTHYSSDSCLVRVTPNKWHKPMRTRQGIDVFTIASEPQTTLHHQIEFLLHYAQLKQNFRHAKHLLSIAELRNQWLVENAPEALAYVSHNRLLYVNTTFLALLNLHSVEEAQATLLSNIVPATEHSLVIPLTQQAEYYSLPIHRVTAWMRPIGKQPLRCELRISSAVYGGQRCSQLVIVPLQDSTLPEDEPQSGANPWQKQNQALVQAQQDPAKPLMRLQLHETLNLHTHHLPTLYIADNLATNRQGQTVNRRELLTHLSDPKKRIELDRWNLQQVLQRLPELNQKNPALAPPQVLIELGEWFWKSTKLRNQLISQLTDTSGAQQLIIMLPYSALVAHQTQLATLSPILKNSQLRFGISEVNFESTQLMEYLTLFNVVLVRLDTAMGLRIGLEHTLPNDLNHLLFSLKSHGVRLLVDGITDIASMNLFSGTEVAYLYGSILERLSQ